MNYFSQVVSVKQGPQRKKTTVPQAIKKSKIFLIKSSCLSISCPLTRKEINTLSLKTKK